MTDLQASYRTDEVTVHLTLLESDAYHLEWTDGVNEWTENYPTPELALARFAALVAGVAQERFLAEEPLQFVLHAQEFLDSQLTPPLERSRFRLGQLVTVQTATINYTARFLREERNADRSLNGVALVKITEHPERGYVGQELHVGISVLEPM